MNLEQISIFAGIVNQMIKERGLENISQHDIFSDQDVRDILGLDQKGTYEYTPLKKGVEKVLVPA